MTLLTRDWSLPNTNLLTTAEQSVMSEEYCSLRSAGLSTPEVYVSHCPKLLCNTVCKHFCCEASANAGLAQEATTGPHPKFEDSVQLCIAVGDIPAGQA